MADLDVMPALHGISFESFNHTNTVLKGLNDLRLKECLFDITLIAEEKSFKVNLLNFVSVKIHLNLVILIFNRRTKLYWLLVLIIFVQCLRIA